MTLPAVPDADDSPTVPLLAQVPRQRGAPDTARAEVLVAVGTDEHRFDRLIGWLEEWYPAFAARVDMTVQHGHTRPPRIPGAVPFLGHAELQRAMAQAALVVCHGGPATILEARRHGHLPIVVPRDPRHGEHVDDHQQLFTRRLGAAGMIVLCDSREVLYDVLAAGIASPAAFAVAADPDAQAARLAAVARVGRIVEELIRAAPHQRRGNPRRWWRPWTRRSG